MGCEADKASRLVQARLGPRQALGKASFGQGKSWGQVLQVLGQVLVGRRSASVIPGPKPSPIAPMSGLAQWRIDPTDRSVTPTIYDVHAAGASMDEHQGGGARHIEFEDRIADRKRVQRFGGLPDDGRVIALGLG